MRRLNKYSVYFEIYGKKMKTEAYAETEDLARQSIMSKIIFHKVELIEDKPKGEYNMFDMLNSVINSNRV